MSGRVEVVGSKYTRQLGAGVVEFGHPLNVKLYSSLLQHAWSRRNPSLCGQGQAAANSPAAITHPDVRMYVVICNFVGSGMC